MFKIIPKTRSKKNSKPTPDEIARVKKVKNQRKRLEEADAYARARNILSYDPETDVTSIDLVTDREWLIQEAREAEAELLPTIPSLAVSIYQEEIVEDEAILEETEDVPVPEEILEEIPEGTEGGVIENPFQFDDDTFDGGDDLSDQQAYQPASQAQVVNTWGSMMSKLVKCYFEQLGRLGEPVIATSFVEPFSCEDCEVPFEKMSRIKVYFFNGVKDVEVAYCSCLSLPEVLVTMGLFPSSPKQPTTAFSFGLLKFFEKVRNTLKASGQGITSLYNEMQEQAEKSYLFEDMCRSVLYMYAKFKLAVDQEVLKEAGIKDQCYDCPACPAVTSIRIDDRRFIAMDGNFSQQCRRKATEIDASNTVASIDELWVKKEEVDAFQSEAPPQDAIANEHDFRAAGTGARRRFQHPVTGLFASLCARHEIVHKVVDMDSAEGLKYPLSVLKNMFPGEEMPAGKVNVMYDIACLFANSFKQHFLDKGLKGRLAVPIFHAYAHVLSCQAKYNPRNLVEFGRTDGEATERLWADLNPFVKLTRSMLQSNRKLVLGQAIRYRNEAKKMNIAEALLKRFDNATAIVALKERELQGVSHAQRESEFQAWTEALRKVSLGKSCNKIWSDLPAEYGPVSRYYLIQAIVWRFGIYLAQFQTIAEPRLAFSDYDRSSSVTVAGETFFCSQLNKMVKELNRMREFISVSFPGFVLFDHDALNETTFNATCCLWEQFVERKKVLFKEAIRSNVWAYNNTFNKLHKQGHVGTKLAGRHTIALGLQKKRLEDLIKLYNKEFPQDLLSWAKVVDPQDSFWGVSPSGIANMVMELRVAEEERMIVRRELNNLHLFITNEAKSWEEAKLEIEGRPSTRANKGLASCVEKKIEANKKWKKRSLFTFGRIQADPTIEEFEREEEYSVLPLLSTMDYMMDSVAGEDLLVVEEGDASSDDSDLEED